MKNRVIKIGLGKKSINIKYEIFPIVGLVGFRISCWFKKDKIGRYFSYYEPDRKKVENGLSKELKDIIKNIFIGNFTDIYFKYVSYSLKK